MMIMPTEFAAFQRISGQKPAGFKKITHERLSGQHTPRKASLAATLEPSNARCGGIATGVEG
jgi:hypothetical protein